MNRYFFYLLALNMLVNVLATVPIILIRQRFQGSVMSMLAAVAVRTALLYVFSRSIARFPHQGLPEILELWWPAAVRKTILLVLSLTFFFAGAITMMVFAEYTVRYINPELANWHVLSIFLFVVLWISGHKSRSVLFALEIILLLSSPLITFILIKAMFSNYMRWDGISAVIQYTGTMPTFSAVAAASYVFSGYTNMVVFNRAFRQFEFRRGWIVSLLGFLIMLSTTFIPIGYLGSDGIDRYVFPWMSTTDSMRVELGFVERVMFIFYVLYGLLAFISIIVHWHVAMELGKSLWSRYDPNAKRKYPWPIAAVFSIAMIVMGYIFNDRFILEITNGWLMVRFAMETLLAALVYFAARRVGHGSNGT